MVFTAYAEGAESGEKKIYCNATLENEFAEDRIMVVLSNEASLEYLQTETMDFPELKQVNIKRFTDTRGKQIKTMMDERKNASLTVRIFTSDANAEEIADYREVLCIELAEHGKDKVLEAIALLEQREDVLYVGPDYKIELCAATDSTSSASDIWAPEAIDLPDALNMVANPQTVLVGVLDSGIDASHSDFVGKVNTKLSKNFITYTSGNTFENDISPLTDPLGHGTHVAGIIGAAANASVGTAGVCQNVEFVSLRVFDSNGLCYSSFVADAIQYVIDQWGEGTMIPILNFSGGWLENSPIYSTYDVSLKEIIKLYPGLFICGAGNDYDKVKELDNSEDSDDAVAFYPASYNLGDYNNMIVVGASNRSDNGLWIGTTKPGSNYGEYAVDIFAPGDRILSCYPSALCSGCFKENGELKNQNHVEVGYHYDSGTSMATPYVTGVAALLLSTHPELSVDQIKTRILNNVDTKSWLTENCASGGRLNAYKALYACHTFEDFTEYDASYHIQSCSQCQYEETAAHTFGNWKTNSYGCQYRTCTECLYTERLHKKSATFVQNDATTHDLLYPCCGFVIQVSHTWTVWIDLDSTYHRRTCTDCGYEQTQTHSECWNKLKNKCNACGWTEIISGGTILSVPDEEETEN